MSCLILAGGEYNLLARTAGVVPSPSEDALFPPTRLYDGRAGWIFKFGSLTADPKLTCDLDLLASLGGFEVAGTPPGGWTDASSGGATVTSTTSTPFTGSRCAEFDAGAGVGFAKITKDISVRSNEKLRIQLRVRPMSTSTAKSLDLQIRDLRTGKYLQPGLTWAAGEIAALTLTGADDAWSAQQAIQFTVDTVANTLNDSTLLRITLLYTGSIANDKIRADEMFVIPAVDFASLHGTQIIDPLNAITLRSSTDNFSGSDTAEATFTLRPGACYVKLGSPVYRQYWRVKFTGTNSTATGAIGLGEWVLGQAVTLAKAPAYSPRLVPSHAQIRGGLPLGGSYAYGLGGQPRTDLELQWGWEESQHTDWLNELFLRSPGGEPMVIVPSDTEGEVYLVRPPAAYDMARVVMDFRQSGSLRFEAMPLPVITS